MDMEGPNPQEIYERLGVNYAHVLHGEQHFDCHRPAFADLRRIFVRQLQIFGSSLGSLGEFRDLLAFVERTGLRPVIDSEYPLDEVHAALDRLESGAQFGKVVLRIDGHEERPA